MQSRRGVNRSMSDFLTHSRESVKCCKSNLNIWMFCLSISPKNFGRVASQLTRKWRCVVLGSIVRGMVKKVALRRLSILCALAICPIYVVYTPPKLRRPQLDKYLYPLLWSTAPRSPCLSYWIVETVNTPVEGEIYNVTAISSTGGLCSTPIITVNKELTPVQLKLSDSCGRGNNNELS